MISYQSYDPPNVYQRERFDGNGFRIERGLFSSVTSAERNQQHSHVLQINSGSPISFSRQSHGKITTGICETGAIFQLLSNGEIDQLQCKEHYSAIELSLRSDFIDKVLDKETFTFDTQFNFRDPLLYNLVHDLCKSAYSRTSEYLYIESLVIACAIHIATTYTGTNKRIFSLKGKLSSSQLQRVIAFIRESINRTVTLEELASRCHLSVFHFSRLFKNTLGVSPYQYALRTKIEYARSLIESKQAVGEIAYNLGFTDSAHFCNAFKKLMGHSPLQYVAITNRLRIPTQYALAGVVSMS
jgi:AraC family transcriptional regulator